MTEDRSRRSVPPEARVAQWAGLVVCLVAILAVGPAASAWSISTSRPVDWSRLRYPVECDRTPTGVLEAVRVPGTGNDDVTVVLLQCLWEDGTGWSSVLSYGVNGPEPRLLQVLLSTEDGWTPVRVKRVGDYINLWKGRGGFSLRLAAARGNAPRCCLNVFATLSWRWSAGRFHEVGRQPPHDPGA